MYWIFSEKFVYLGDSCTVGGDPAMNIIIARVPVLNGPCSACGGALLGVRRCTSLWWPRVSFFRVRVRLLNRNSGPIPAPK